MGLNGELFEEKLDQETGDLIIDINKIMLGIPWLSKHNLEINWKTNKI
jgi:hypothetical protein